jgi:hypothetical protein
MTVAFVVLLILGACLLASRQMTLRPSLAMKRVGSSANPAGMEQQPSACTPALAGQFTEREQTSISSALAHHKAGQHLQEVLSQAGPQERAVAAALERFAASGAMAELRALDRQQVVALAQYLSQNLASGELSELLQSVLGWTPPADLPPEGIRDLMVETYDAIAGHHLEEVRPAVLTVTDAADAAGRISGASHVLPAGTQRVYAVFENDWSLKGLDQVLAVWRDPNDDRMVFTEFEQVRKGSAYNYVWLEVESGWPAGRYQVELFHPEAQSLLLASESFSVR